MKSIKIVETKFLSEKYLSRIKPTNISGSRPVMNDIACVACNVVSQIEMTDNYNSSLVMLPLKKDEEFSMTCANANDENDVVAYTT